MLTKQTTCPDEVFHEGKETKFKKFNVIVKDFIDKTHDM
jgi:hypothetical protein